MKVTYATPAVEKCFTDYSVMKKKLPLDIVKQVKKHMDRLEAAETFGDFLSLRLGRPEPLTGYSRPRYSVRVSPNIRLILEPNVEGTSVQICSEIEVEGVCDYHGDKENWYIA